jgi:diguanylate cyclase (GGDEF)-like protein
MPQQRGRIDTAEPGSPNRRDHERGDQEVGVAPGSLTHPEPPLNDGPFERQGLFRRVVPFALVSAFAEASLALSPGSASPGYALLSVALLGVVAAALFLPWHRLPSQVAVLVPMVTVVFVLTLILATGTSSSGVGIIVLVPLVWTVLYHHRWESFVVVGTIVLTEIITSLTPVQVDNVVIFRRVVVWVALGLLISVTTHALRDRLQRSLDQREASLRRSVAFGAAAEELTKLLDPSHVIATAVRLAAGLVSPPGTRGRRAQYVRRDGDMITVVAQWDETGLAVTVPFPLAEQPNLVEVFGSGVTVQLPVDPDAAGPIVRSLIETTGVTNSVYIPVHLDGRIDGVLSIPMRGRSIDPDLVDFCRTFGHLVELALGNAFVHQALEEQATSDKLTNLPNRRAFDRLILNGAGRTCFSIVAIDLDGLKQVNDTLGHSAGDQMLIHAAHAMQSALRHGDVVARMGGDEFAAFLFGADSVDALLVGQRIQESVGSLPSGSLVPSFSIGIATGEPDSDPLEVLHAADEAMYRAKRRGGGHVVVAERQVPVVSFSR